ncbi:MAG: BrnT family toxin, partial [Spirochaetaceae bacterium]|nr:BrnT family toxin [Spirochaetaceae bacterium]
MRQTSLRRGIKPDFANKILSDGIRCWNLQYSKIGIWHNKKNELNKNKHGIGFEEATGVFDDPFSYEVFDASNSLDEDRYRVIGAITGFVLGRFVTVSVTYQDELIRIFSARDAGQTEIEEY